MEWGGLGWLRWVRAGGGRWCGVGWGGGVLNWVKPLKIKSERPLELVTLSP